MDSLLYSVMAILLLQPPTLVNASSLDIIPAGFFNGLSYLTLLTSSFIHGLYCLFGILSTCPEVPVSNRICNANEWVFFSSILLLNSTRAEGRNQSPKMEQREVAAEPALMKRPTLQNARKMLPLPQGSLSGIQRGLEGQDGKKIFLCSSCAHDP